MKRVGGSGRGTRSTETTYEGDVTVLTVGNFEREVMMNEDMWLVEFYAPWCGHCKQLAPEWEKAATTLKGKVKLGKVDATVEKQLGDKYEVKGFPTIKVFPPYDKEKA
jgi:protein disulfide-isomerase A6